MPIRAVWLAERNIRDDKRASAMLKRMRHLIWLLLTVVVASSCSMHLAYHHVDRVVAWRVDDLLDLTREQRSFVMERVRYHQTWHREQELLRYRQFLDGVETRLKNGLNEQEVDWFFDQIQDFRSTLMTAISADAAQLLRGISADQREYLREALARSNRKLEERAELNETERRKRRAKEVIAEIEHWTGRLDRGQRERIVQELGKLPDMTAPWLSYKRERQQQLLQLLKQDQNHDPAQFDAALHAWLLENSSARFADFQQQVKHAAVAIDRLLTPAQRMHAVRELHKLRETLDGLRDA